MSRTIRILILAAALIVTPAISAQDVQPTPPAQPIDKAQQGDLRAEIDELKKMVKALEEKFAAQETKQAEQAKVAEPTTEAKEETTAQIKELDRRVTKTERDTALQRIRFGGDYRFEAHSIRANVPAHYDGMKLQSLLVRTMFAMGVLGRPPMSVNEINSTVAQNYSSYQYFTSNLTFRQLREQMAAFPPEMQQQLFGMLLPETFVPETKANNGILYTNRFRFRIDTQVAENMHF